MTTQPITIANDVNYRTAMRVLNDLDRWSERLESQFAQKRASARTTVRSLV